MQKAKVVMLRRLLPVAALVLLAGCSVSKSVMVWDMPPVAWEQIQVYSLHDELPEHVHIAVLTGRRNHLFSTRKGLMKKLKKKAAELGANAIIMRDLRHSTVLDVTFELALLAGMVELLLGDLTSYPWLLGSAVWGWRVDTAIAIHIPDTGQLMLSNTTQW